MRLEAANGMSFNFEVVGYQYPEEETREYDSNWLRIKIDVSHPKGDWTATDPCLLTREIGELADWLEAIQHGERVPKVLGFIEPNLWFQLRTANKIKGKVLRVYIAFELRPVWAKDATVGKDKLWVDFPLAEIDLMSACRQLREYSQQFPQRAIV